MISVTPQSERQKIRTGGGSTSLSRLHHECHRFREEVLCIRSFPELQLRWPTLARLEIGNESSEEDDTVWDATETHPSGTLVVCQGSEGSSGAALKDSEVLAAKDIAPVRAGTKEKESMENLKLGAKEDCGVHREVNGLDFTEAPIMEISRGREGPDVDTVPLSHMNDDEASQTHCAPEFKPFDQILKPASDAKWPFHHKEDGSLSDSIRKLDTPESRNLCEFLTISGARMAATALFTANPRHNCYELRSESDLSRNFEYMIEESGLVGLAGFNVSDYESHNERITSSEPCRWSSFERHVCSPSRVNGRVIVEERKQPTISVEDDALTQVGNRALISSPRRPKLSPELCRSCEEDRSVKLKDSDYGNLPRLALCYTKERNQNLELPTVQSKDSNAMVGISALVQRIPSSPTAVSRKTDNESVQVKGATHKRLGLNGSMDEVYRSHDRELVEDLVHPTSLASHQCRSSNAVASYSLLKDDNLSAKNENHYPCPKANLCSGCITPHEVENLARLGKGSTRDSIMSSLVALKIKNSFERLDNYTNRFQERWTSSNNRTRFDNTSRPNDERWKHALHIPEMSPENDLKKTDAKGEKDCSTSAVKGGKARMLELCSPMLRDGNEDKSFVMGDKAAPWRNIDCESICSTLADPDLYLQQVLAALDSGQELSDKHHSHNSTGDRLDTDGPALKQKRIGMVENSKPQARKDFTDGQIATARADQGCVAEQVKPDTPSFRPGILVERSWPGIDEQRIVESKVVQTFESGIPALMVRNEKQSIVSVQIETPSGTIVEVQFGGNHNVHDRQEMLDSVDKKSHPLPNDINLAQEESFNVQVPHGESVVGRSSTESACPAKASSLAIASCVESSVDKQGGDADQYCQDSLHLSPPVRLVDSAQYPRTVKLITQDSFDKKVEQLVKRANRLEEESTLPDFSSYKVQSSRAHQERMKGSKATVKSSRPAQCLASECFDRSNEPKAQTKETVQKLQAFGIAGENRAREKVQHNQPEKRKRVAWASPEVQILGRQIAMTPQHRKSEEQCDTRNYPRPSRQAPGNLSKLAVEAVKTAKLMPKRREICQKQTRDIKHGGSSQTPTYSYKTRDTAGQPTTVAAEFPTSVRKSEPNEACDESDLHKSFHRDEFLEELRELQAERKRLERLVGTIFGPDHHTVIPKRLSVDSDSQERTKPKDSVGQLQKHCDAAMTEESEESNGGCYKRHTTSVPRRMASREAGTRSYSRPRNCHTPQKRDDVKCTPEKSARQPKQRKIKLSNSNESLYEQSCSEPANALADKCMCDQPHAHKTTGANNYPEIPPKPLTTAGRKLNSKAILSLSSIARSDPCASDQQSHKDGPNTNEQHENGPAHSHSIADIRRGCSNENLHNITFQKPPQSNRCREKALNGSSPESTRQVLVAFSSNTSAAADELSDGSLAHTGCTQRYQLSAPVSPIRDVAVQKEVVQKTKEDHIGNNSENMPNLDRCRFKSITKTIDARIESTQIGKYSENGQELKEMMFGKPSRHVWEVGQVRHQKNSESRVDSHIGRTPFKFPMDETGSVDSEMTRCGSCPDFLGQDVSPEENNSWSGSLKSVRPAYKAARRAAIALSSLEMGNSSERASFSSQAAASKKPVRGEKTANVMKIGQKQGEDLRSQAIVEGIDRVGRMKSRQRSRQGYRDVDRSKLMEDVRRRGVVENLDVRDQSEKQRETWKFPKSVFQTAEFGTIRKRNWNDSTQISQDRDRTVADANTKSMAQLLVTRVLKSELTRKPKRLKTKRLQSMRVRQLKSTSRKGMNPADLKAYASACTFSKGIDKRTSSKGALAMQTEAQGHTNSHREADSDANRSKAWEALLRMSKDSENYSRTEHRNPEAEDLVLDECSKNPNRALHNLTRYGESCSKLLDKDVRGSIEQWLNASGGFEYLDAIDALNEADLWTGSVEKTKYSMSAGVSEKSLAEVTGLEIVTSPRRQQSTGNASVNEDSLGKAENCPDTGHLDIGKTDSHTQDEMAERTDEFDKTRGTSVSNVDNTELDRHPFLEEDQNPRLNIVEVPTSSDKQSEAQSNRYAIDSMRKRIQPSCMIASPRNSSSQNTRSTIDTNMLCPKELQLEKPQEGSLAKQSTVRGGAPICSAENAGKNGKPVSKSDTMHSEDEEIELALLELVMQAILKNDPPPEGSDPLNEKITSPVSKRHGQESGNTDKRLCRALSTGEESPKQFIENRASSARVEEPAIGCAYPDMSVNANACCSTCTSDGEWPEYKCFAEIQDGLGGYADDTDCSIRNGQEFEVGLDRGMETEENFLGGMSTISHNGAETFQNRPSQTQGGSTRPPYTTIDSMRAAERQPIDFPGITSLAFGYPSPSPLRKPTVISSHERTSVSVQTGELAKHTTAPSPPLLVLPFYWPHFASSFFTLPSPDGPSFLSTTPLVATGQHEAQFAYKHALAQAHREASSPHESYSIFSEASRGVMPVPPNADHSSVTQVSGAVPTAMANLPLPPRNSHPFSGCASQPPAASLPSDIVTTLTLDAKSDVDRFANTKRVEHVRVTEKQSHFCEKRESCTSSNSGYSSPTTPSAYRSSPEHEARIASVLVKSHGSDQRTVNCEFDSGPGEEDGTHIATIEIQHKQNIDTAAYGQQTEARLKVMEDKDFEPQVIVEQTRDFQSTMEVTSALLIKPSRPPVSKGTSESKSGCSPSSSSVLLGSYDGSSSSEDSAARMKARAASDTSSIQSSTEKIRRYYEKPSRPNYLGVMRTSELLSSGELLPPPGLQSHLQGSNQPHLQNQCYWPTANLSEGEVEPGQMPSEGECCNARKVQSSSFLKGFTNHERHFSEPGEICRQNITLREQPSIICDSKCNTPIYLKREFDSRTADANNLN